jgi:hypothetical protein
MDPVGTGRDSPKSTHFRRSRWQGQRSVRIRRRCLVPVKCLAYEGRDLGRSTETFARGVLMRGDVYFVVG